METKEWTRGSLTVWRTSLKATYLLLYSAPEAILGSDAKEFYGQAKSLTRKRLNNGSKMWTVWSREDATTECEGKKFLAFGREGFWSVACSRTSTRLLFPSRNSYCPRQTSHCGSIETYQLQGRTSNSLSWIGWWVRRNSDWNRASVMDTEEVQYKMRVGILGGEATACV